MFFKMEENALRQAQHERRWIYEDCLRPSPARHIDEAALHRQRAERPRRHPFDKRHAATNDRIADALGVAAGVVRRWVEGR